MAPVLSSLWVHSFDLPGMLEGCWGGGPPDFWCVTSAVTRERTLTTSLRKYKVIFTIANGSVGVVGQSKQYCDDELWCGRIAYNTPQPLGTWGLGSTSREHYWIGSVSEDKEVGGSGEAIESMSFTWTKHPERSFQCRVRGVWPPEYESYNPPEDCAYIDGNWGVITFATK